MGDKLYLIQSCETWTYGDTFLDPQFWDDPQGFQSARELIEKMIETKPDKQRVKEEESELLGNFQNLDSESDYGTEVTSEDSLSALGRLVDKITPNFEPPCPTEERKPPNLHHHQNQYSSEKVLPKSISDNISIHRKKKRTDKRFTCTICEKKFSEKHHLISHTRTHHTGEKPYSCTQCSFKSSNQASLTYHVRTHTGHRPFSCTHCEAKFTRSNHLKTHLLVHTGEKGYVCEHCGAKFAQSGVLKRHVLKHTGEKAFTCHLCGKAFGRKGDLKRHTQIHTEIKTSGAEVDGQSD